MAISQKGQKRYDMIMEVGLELFLKNGYEGTSLNDIVVKSGGSLASIYKYFTNKEGLFATIIEKNFDLFCAELDEKMNLRPSNDLAEILQRFGILYLELFCKPNAIALSRLIISECYKNKYLGERFSQNIVDKTCKILTSYFERDDVKPRLKEYNFEELSLKFCALIREPYHLDAVILGRDIRLTKAKQEAMVRSSVDLFLYGVYK